MIISIIVAFSKTHRVIGKEGRLPWRFPEDMARFKRFTMGHFCVVGYNTFSTLPPLSGRRLIVLSKNHQIDREGVFCASSPDEAIEIAKKHNETELFCIGGGEIYKLFLPIAERLYITEVLQEVEGDTFFPIFDESQYVIEEKENLDKIIFKTYKK